MSWAIDVIEEMLVNGGVDVEDYTDPRKGITKLEAVLNAIDGLIGRAQKGAEE